MAVSNNMELTINIFFSPVARIGIVRLMIFLIAKKKIEVVSDECQISLSKWHP
jgi:hypothetical protein